MIHLFHTAARKVSGCLCALTLSVTDKDFHFGSFDPGITVLWVTDIILTFYGRIRRLEAFKASLKSRRLPGSTMMANSQVLFIKKEGGRMSYLVVLGTSSLHQLQYLYGPVLIFF